MGSNYTNQPQENYCDEKISFPTDAGYETNDSMSINKPLVSREVIKTHFHPKKKSNGLLISLLSGLLALLIVLLIVVIVMAGRKDDSQKNTKSDEAVTMEENVQSETFVRYSTFNKGYTYDEMPYICNSTESENEKCVEMANFIKTFNNAWINYVNYNDTTVYNYLRQGTKPYQYAVNFGKKELTEEYQIMQVNDVREYGDTYYVWTYEVISKYSGGKTSQAVYHWIYKIGKDASGYYVELYKKDPYYN